jgi:hypothetical protein
MNDELAAGETAPPTATSSVTQIGYYRRSTKCIDEPVILL